MLWEGQAKGTEGRWLPVLAWVTAKEHVIIIIIIIITRYSTLVDLEAPDPETGVSSVYL